MKEKIINTARWLAVYPVCLLVYILAFLIINFANTRKDEDGALSIVALVAPLLSAGIASYVAMKAAYSIAPNNKHFATLLLLIFIIAFIGYEVYLIFSLGFEWGRLQIIIGNIIGGVGGFISADDD